MPTDPTNKNSTTRSGAQAEQNDPLLSETKPDLKSTADAFSTLISAKMKEQEIKVGEAEQALQERHMKMLRSLMEIRRSLSDICRIDLGKRFNFNILKDDWQGWPRITVKLIDLLQPNDDLPYFQVTAHDRGSQGMIEVFYLSLQKPYTVSAVDENDWAHLPQILKRAVRGFLDLVTETIIKISSQNEASDEDQKNLATKNLNNFEEQNINLHDEGLFVKDHDLDEIFEALPTLDEVSKLPSSKGKTTK